MEPQWDVSAGYLCSVQQGWARATLPSGVLTTSNLSPHSPLPSPCFNPFILLAQRYSQTCFLHITLHPLPLLPLPPPAGGIRDGDIRQGSEPVLRGEVAGDVPRAELPWNTWTRVPGHKGKGGGWHRRLWGGLPTAETQTVKNRWESGPHQVRTSHKRNKRSEKLSSSCPTLLLRLRQQTKRTRFAVQTAWFVSSLPLKELLSTALDICLYQKSWGQKHRSAAFPYFMDTQELACTDFEVGLVLQ